MEPDIGHVMLAAGVGAARDVDAKSTYFSQSLSVKFLLDRIGKTATLSDGKIAGVGAWAGHNIAY
jgi:hypothetical protein